MALSKTGRLIQLVPRILAGFTCHHPVTLSIMIPKLRLAGSRSAAGLVVRVCHCGYARARRGKGPTWGLSVTVGFKLGLATRCRVPGWQAQMLAEAG